MTDWTIQKTLADNVWNSACYGNNLFVAVASSGTGNRVMTSTDGISWAPRTSAADNQWSSVCYGNNLFVAVASNGTGNRVMSSPDGITWTSRTSAADNQWNSVCYGNGLFIAVSLDGSGNRVMSSPDGITWESRTSAADNVWGSVCYGNGLFVAVASSGTGTRVMTGVDNSCFLKGSKILTQLNDYVNIEDLKINDLIKIYPSGYKKITHIGKKSYSNSSNNELFCMYKHKKNDLIISGGHSILVDNLTEEQLNNQNKYSFNYKIKDKFLLLSCFCDDFEKIEINNEVMEIYHLCLENEDENAQDGIWANEILAETCSVKHFKIMNFEMI
jgi:predicted RecA/RadA family phage recombinase